MFAIALLASPLMVDAQTPHADFGHVAERLTQGDRTVVWTATGEVVRGRLVRADGDGLVIERASQTIALPAERVRRVERAVDRVWDGAMIGFGVGFAAGALSMATCEPEGWFCDHSARAVLACGSLAGAFGFGVGALVDVLIRPERLIFERGRETARVTLTPIMSRTGAAVMVRVAF
jgi:hypothetical protein